MVKNLEEYDFSHAVKYHEGKFPPADLRYERLVQPLAAATAALTRYDTKLERLHNKELLLAPLRNAEAVVSSRIEGTIATLDEILRIQADADDAGEDDGRYRHEAIEVYSYTRALRYAQILMDQGLPISSRLIKETHSRLLFFGRGADKNPGNYKKDQNYIADQRDSKILFIPKEPSGLEDGIAALETYVNNLNIEPLIQTAIMHVEFEALHPFKDGNGRLGRMLVPLNLWQRNLIHTPHFYVSPAIEERRGEYIERLRDVSEKGAWTEWVSFFLEILQRQSELNVEITDKIESLYTEMEVVFRDTLQSKWAHVAQDYIFSKGYFRNSAFTSGTEIPSQTAHRIIRQLVDSSVLTVIEPASGRRAAMLAFTPLLEVVRA